MKAQVRTLGWAVLVLGGALTVVAIAEDVSVSTYYPSPKGVYQELRTTAAPACVTMTQQRIVRGASLTPLLQAGDEVTLTMDPEGCLPIARGEIIAYQHPSRPTPFLKVVKAVPGDRVALRQEADGWRLLVNSTVVTNTEGLPYAFGERAGRVLGAYAEDVRGVVPPERYLVLGNLIRGSIDSSRFGLVERARIVGKLASGPRR